MSAKQEKQIHYSITGEQEIDGSQSGVLQVIRLCLQSGFFGGINQVLDFLTPSLSSREKNSPEQVAERMIDRQKRSSYYTSDRGW